MSPTEPDATRPVVPLGLSMSSLGGTRLIRIDGEVDIATAPALRKALVEVLGARPDAVVVDLDGVPFLDSTGLGVLVGAHRSAAALNVALHLARPRRIVANALRLGQIDTVISVYDTVEQAMCAAGGAPDEDPRDEGRR